MKHAWGVFQVFTNMFTLSVCSQMRQSGSSAYTLKRGSFFSQFPINSLDQSHDTSALALSPTTIAKLMKEDVLELLKKIPCAHAKTTHRLSDSADVLSNMPAKNEWSSTYFELLQHLSVSTSVERAA